MINKDNINLYVSQRVHYTQIVSETNDALSCYYGGTALERLIERFSDNEIEEKYRWRVKAVVRNFDNYVKEISNQYIEGVFRPGGVLRSVSSDILQRSIETRYTAFINKLLPISLLLPELYVKICLPKFESSSVVSKQDVIDKKIIPYPAMIFPQYIRSYELNDEGTLKWISVVSEQTEEYEEYHIYDELTKYTVRVADRKAALVAEEFHGHKNVPFVRISWADNNSVEGRPKPGYSMMYDVINKTIGAMVWLSMLHESGLFHLFPKLVTDARTFDSIQKAGGDLSVNKVIKEEIGPDGGALATRYLDMPSTEFDLLDKIYYERIPNSIYRAARLRDRSTEKSQSGISKLFDMVPEISVLSSIAQYFQRFEAEIIRKMADVFDAGSDVVVQYPTTFDVKSVNEILSEVGQLVETLDKTSLPESKTAAQKIALELYRRILPNLTSEELKKIEQEVLTEGV